MHLTAAEARLLKKLFDEMKTFNRNRLVVMSKLPPARLIEKDGKRFTQHEISPEWVDAMKRKLPTEVLALGKMGLVQVFVDGSDTLKHGKIDFVAHMTPEGLAAFKSNLSHRAAILAAHP